MSKRDNGVSRRLRWGAGVAAVLVLGTGTAAAHAVWQSRVALPAETVSSGSLALSAEWVGSWDEWKPLFPGQSSDTATLHVTETGQGTTLRWRVAAEPEVAAGLAEWVKTEVFVGACGRGQLIPAGGSYAPPGGYASGASVDLCLRVMLLPGAPDEQSVPIEPRLKVRAQQVTE